MDPGWITAMVIGALIITGLSFYLGRLLLLLNHSRQVQQAKTATRNKTLAESIYTIAWAMREGQCEHSEGCLRIWVLVDHIVAEKTAQPQPNNELLYPGIFALYGRVKELPTHDARKKVNKTQLRAMDEQRLKDETEFKDLIAIDVARLIERFKA